MRSFEYISKSIIAGTFDISALAVWGTATLISILTVPVYTPTNNEKSSHFSKFSPEFVIICFLDISHSEYN